MLWSIYCQQTVILSLSFTTYNYLHITSLTVIYERWVLILKIMSHMVSKKMVDFILLAKWVENSSHYQICYQFSTNLEVNIIFGGKTPANALCYHVMCNQFSNNKRWCEHTGICKKRLVLQMSVISKMKQCCA